MGMHVLKLTDIGEGVVEGEVVQWHVRVGDAVKEDDPIVDVMTDKANVEISSPRAGVILRLFGEPGDIIATGTPPGVGFARKPPIWLKDGDVMEVDIEGLGRLRNTVRSSS